MAYGSRNFPEGVIPELQPPEVPVIYRDLSNEVHALVQRMLESTGEPELAVTSRLRDSAELAARIVELSVGGTLPTYDHSGEGDPMVETGHTRVIEAGDRFEVAAGPAPFSDGQGYAALMQRAA